MEKLNRILESYMAKDGLPGKDQLLGAAFVVVSQDEILYQGAAGRTSSDADAPRFSTDSFTWVASMTKIVTATCVMQVVEKGLIGLDDDVRPLVPQLAETKILRGFVGDDVPYLEENTDPITLRQLLTHTAGFGYGNADPDLARWARHVGRDHERLEGTVEAWHTPLKFAPGRGWYYGSGVDWAGQVVERLTGRTLGAHLAGALLAPLGMRDTGFALRRGAGAAAAVPTAHRDAATGALASEAPPVPAEGGVESGGAGLYTTAADHARLLQALLRSSSSSEGGGLLRRETVDELFRPQLTDGQRRWLGFLTGLFYDGMTPDFEPGMPLDHGLGGAINMRDSAGKRRKGSMMWAGMCNGHWFVDRESGIGATFITNVLPQPDAVVIKIWDELERAVYSDLLPSARP